jgi:hypothetical protein
METQPSDAFLLHSQGLHRDTRCTRLTLWLIGFTINSCGLSDIVSF